MIFQVLHQIDGGETRRVEQDKNVAVAVAVAVESKYLKHFIPSLIFFYFFFL